MSAQTNVVSDAGFVEAAQPRMRATRPVYWSVKREIWENRSIYIAPLAAAGLVVIGVLFGAFHGTGELVMPDPVRQQMVIIAQCKFSGMLLMLSTFLVSIFYCLDALYGERRDRSVLFWRSLPVSDTVAVLAKAAVPIVILPLLTVVVAAVTQWIVLAIDAATLAAHGQSISVIGQTPVLAMQAGLLYHMIAMHALWYAPIYAWLLLISAWARRVPLLWAFLPPLALVIVEKIAFNTQYVARFIGDRFEGGAGSEGLALKSPVMIHPMAELAPWQFLVSPGLWGGLFVAGLFLAGAVWLRRYRTAN